MKKAILVCLLIFAISIVSIGSFLNVSAKGSKKIKLNKSKITMKVGKRVKLKISPNRKHKIKWTSSKKKIASVSKGIVNAKKPGKTKIIARIGKKKLRCMVTVREASDIVESPAPLDPIYSAVPPAPTETASPIIAPTETPIVTPTGTPIPEFTMPPYDFEPGTILLGLNAPFLGSSLTELFPELDILESKDRSLQLYESVKAASYTEIIIDGITYTKQERLDILKKEIGTSYVIRLVESTKKSVVNAINIMIKSPNVKYAKPNMYNYPDNEND